MLPKTPGMLELEARHPGETIDEILVAAYNAGGSIAAAAKLLDWDYRTLYGYYQRRLIPIRKVARLPGSGAGEVSAALGSER